MVIMDFEEKIVIMNFSPPSDFFPKNFFSSYARGPYYKNIGAIRASLA